MTKIDPFDDVDPMITANNGTGEALGYTLREKCPNTELFLVRIFLYSDCIRIQSEYRKMRIRNNSVFGHFSRSVRQL